MFHAWFYPLSCVLSTLWSTFHMISWTNLLTRAIVPAACFLLFLVPGKSENEYSRNWTGQKSKSLFYLKGVKMISICLYAFSMFVNCPAVICSPSMLSILRRATSSELWIPVLFLYIQSTILYCFVFTFCKLLLLSIRYV